jgi:hypothetical protein
VRDDDDGDDDDGDEEEEEEDDDDDDDDDLMVLMMMMIPLLRLGVTEEQIELEASKSLGALGIEGRRRSHGSVRPPGEFR